ncbi:MAG: AEC family transporter [Anaerolineae bacterium]|nr:AEC family transporter [Anaerolineae bacterium]
MFLHIFLNNLFPVFVIVAAGIVLSLTLKPDVKSVSQAVFYTASPCLIFAGLTRNPMTGTETRQVIAFALLLAATLLALAWGLATALGWRGKRRRAFVLPIFLLNTGNFGLPVVLFAFGAEAQTKAMMYVAINALLTSTLGIFIAAGGRSWRKVLENLAGVPMLYAAIGALLVNVLHWRVPDLIMRPVALMAESGVSMMLLVLGLQLGQSLHQLHNHIGMMSLATVLRLVVAPLVAFWVARVTRVQGVVYQACMLEASTPSGVACAVVALQYDLEPEYVAGTVFMTTVVSALTLSVLIALI